MSKNLFKKKVSKNGDLLLFFIDNKNYHFIPKNRNSCFENKKVIFQGGIFCFFFWMIELFYIKIPFYPRKSQFLLFNLQNSHFWMVRKRHFLHHILKKSNHHTIIALNKIKMPFFTLTNYAVNAFTHPP